MPVRSGTSINIDDTSFKSVAFGICASPGELWPTSIDTIRHGAPPTGALIHEPPPPAGH